MSKTRWFVFFCLFTMLMTLSVMFAAYGFWLSAVGMGFAAFCVLGMAIWENNDFL